MGKQIEMFTPLALGRDPASRTVIAIWIYQDASMAVVYLDFQYKERYILWHAPDAHQFNYDYVEELRIRLSDHEPGDPRSSRRGSFQEITR